MKVNTFENLDGKGLEFAIVRSRFNKEITEGLFKGCLNGLKESGVLKDDIEIYEVPGAFEIPLVAKKLAQGKMFDAVICLGAVIRGETPHFDYVAGEASRGIAEVSRETGMPVIFGVLTTDNLEQAKVRSSDDKNNKGYESAKAGIEMSHLMKKLERFDL